MNDKQILFRQSDAAQIREKGERIVARGIVVYALKIDHVFMVEDAPKGYSKGGPGDYACYTEEMNWVCAIPPQLLEDFKNGVITLYE